MSTALGVSPFSLRLFLMSSREYVLLSQSQNEKHNAGTWLLTEGKSRQM
jgi:hypothetical protein